MKQKYVFESKDSPALLKSNTRARSNANFQKWKVGEMHVLPDNKTYQFILEADMDDKSLTKQMIENMRVDPTKVTVICKTPTHESSAADRARFAVKEGSDTESVVKKLLEEVGVVDANAEVIANSGTYEGSMPTVGQQIDFKTTTGDVRSGAVTEIISDEKIRVLYNSQVYEITVVANAPVDTSIDSSDATLGAPAGVIGEWMKSRGMVKSVKEEDEESDEIKAAIKLLKDAGYTVSK